MNFYTKFFTLLMITTAFIQVQASDQPRDNREPRTFIVRSVLELNLLMQILQQQALPTQEEQVKFAAEIEKLKNDPAVIAQANHYVATVNDEIMKTFSRLPRSNESTIQNHLHDTTDTVKRAYPCKLAQTGDLSYPAHTALHILCDQTRVTTPTVEEYEKYLRDHLNPTTQEQGSQRL